MSSSSQNGKPQMIQKEGTCFAMKYTKRSKLLQTKKARRTSQIRGYGKSEIPSNRSSKKISSAEAWTKSASDSTSHRSSSFEAAAAKMRGCAIVGHRRDDRGARSAPSICRVRSLIKALVQAHKLQL